MPTRTYYRSFAGGEISPEMYGRIDDAKFQSGAAKLENFLVTPTGAAKNRAGFAFVKATRNSGPARLIPFTYSLNQTMVIELGVGYARFHTQGATLTYGAAQRAFVPPATTTAGLAFHTGTPGTVTWPNHTLLAGDIVEFVDGAPPALGGPGGTGTGMPGGIAGLTPYTVVVIDPNTISLTDANGNAVAITSAPTDQVSAFLMYNIGDLVGYLGATYYRHGLQYLAGYSGANPSTTPGCWYLEPSDLTYEIPTPYGLAPVAASPTAAGWSLTRKVPIGGTQGFEWVLGAGLGKGSGTGKWVPEAGISSGVAEWVPVPKFLLPGANNPAQSVQDLWNIHFAQSMDVLTLVHPYYPPAELSRQGATDWTLLPILFGPPLSTPQNVTAVPSPGYKAVISSISLANPALITTQSSHTLALGDGIYIANLTAVIGGVNTVMDGFYMVDLVPKDTNGNLIPNELNVMDYSGNVLDSAGWSSYAATDNTKPITIQYGSKIFNITNPYAVQAVGSDGVSTSPLSASVSALNNLDVPGSYNTVAWSAVTGAQSYNVFKQLNGLWGFIGTTQATTFADNNIAPDMSITPGSPDAVFAAAGDFPGAVCYFQQRRCFAGTDNAPANAWMSNSGTESMFSYSLPSQDTDRIAFRVAALQADQIQHAVPMLQLILLTSEAEFALTPGATNAVTPTNVSVQPQSYVGASYVQPTIINTTMVYAAARGGHVRELGYAWTVNGYMTGDLSLRAAHLFDTYTINDQCYQKAPWPIVWFVSSGGELLGLTYIPEEQMGAWHHHTTQGTFQSICCVAEGTEDVLYAVITRAINGQVVNYVECMQSRFFPEPEDPFTADEVQQPIPPDKLFFVDAGITQTFATPVSVVTGLTWLEGATVAVLADGGVQSQKVVTGGSITLDHAASVVTVGLSYNSNLRTLPAVLQLDGYGQGRMKNVNKAWVKVYQSSGIMVGPSAQNLTEIAQRTTEPWGSPPSLASNELLVLTTPQWQENGQTLIRQQNPLPVDVVGITLEVAIGG
ncbi:MAG TPA: hypothetical protein VGR47_06010 [Terracidiphilus sp.]|nr:hypothetical protein [Terracidiphilus sp.]